MKLFLSIFSLICLFLVNGCTTKIDKEQLQAVTDMATPYAAGAIVVHLQATPDINSVNDMPNSCTVLILQTGDENAQNQLLSNPVALKALFSASVPEDNILKVDRYVLYPGQQATLHIDRALNTRQIAVVAGYYPYPGKKHVLSVPIPVQTWDEGWFRSNWLATLGNLDVSLILGKDGIISATYPKNKDEKPSPDRDSSGQ